MNLSGNPGVCRKSLDEESIDQFFQKSLRWTLNGWSAHEIAGFALCVALCSPLVVSGLLLGKAGN